MDREKLRKQLGETLLGISKMCVAGALAVAGNVAASQAAEIDAVAVGDPTKQAGTASGSIVFSDDAAILLRVAAPDTGDQLARHVSHSSHASHASHASHVSHVSSRTY